MRPTEHDDSGNGTSSTSTITGNANANANSDIAQREPVERKLLYELEEVDQCEGWREGVEAAAEKRARPLPPERSDLRRPACPRRGQLFQQLAVSGGAVRPQQHTLKRRIRTP